MNIYYKDGESSINVLEIDERLNNLAQEEIKKLNNEAKDMGVEIKDGKIKIVDEGKLQEINQDMNHLKQETNNIMDLPIKEDDKQSIQNIINENNYDIKSDSDTTYLELITGIENNLSNDSNFMNILSSEEYTFISEGYIGNTINNIDFFNNDMIEGLYNLKSGAYRIDEIDKTIADICGKL